MPFGYFVLFEWARSRLRHHQSGTLAYPWCPQRATRIVSKGLAARPGGVRGINPPSRDPHPCPWVGVLCIT
jgi:hypothetical protein